MTCRLESTPGFSGDGPFRRLPRQPSLPNSKCEEGLQPRIRVSQKRRHGPKCHVKKRDPGSSCFYRPGAAPTCCPEAEDRRETSLQTNRFHSTENVRPARSIDRVVMEELHDLLSKDDKVFHLSVFRLLCWSFVNQ